MTLSPTLLTAVVVQLLCQLFKTIYYSIREGRPRPGYFFSAGGMPSAHSAFVTALTVSLGLRQGFGSELFGLSFVFSVIVVYDSIRLRGAVQIHSRLLAGLLERFPDARPPAVQIPRLVGHTPPETAAGVLAGGLFSWLVYRWLPI
jgi:hypothetical protein